jgi:flagellin
MPTRVLPKNIKAFDMSTTVTPSAAGSHLPPDARPQNPGLARRPSAEQQTEKPAGDSAEISQPSYADRSEPPASEVSSAISFTQTQGGFLQLVEKALDRMGELSTLCQDSTKTENERVHYTVEFTQLQNFISDIGAKKFNGLNLFSGKAPAIRLDDCDRELPIDVVDLNASEPAGGVADAVRYSSADVNTHTSAAAALVRVQKALDNLIEMQGKVSSNLQRLNLTSAQMSVLTENLSAANSRIQDIELAKSVAQAARRKMLGQSGTVISAQANAGPQAAIRLLE